MKTEQETRVGSLLNKGDRIYAASLVTRGEVIGVFNRGVNALWIDGTNEEAARRLQIIKGELRQGRPVALTIGFERLIKMIDFDVLAEDVKQFLKSSGDLKGKLGSLCFLRVPLQASYIDKVPPSSLSLEKGQTWIQSWDAHGHRFTEDLMRLMEGFGVEYPAVTSMNISGSPEIVNQDEGERFCREKNIPVYLRDPKANPEVMGSYTIIAFNEQGIELIRDGNVPGNMIEHILHLPLITERTTPPKYSQLNFSKDLIEGLSPQGVRMASLLYLGGRNPSTINQTLRRFRVFIE